MAPVVLPSSLYTQYSRLLKSCQVSSQTGLDNWLKAKYNGYMKPKGTKDRAHVFTGLSRTRFYRIYKGMWQRCTDKNAPKYRTYGARGVKCFWPRFVDFKNDMHGSYLEHVLIHGEKETTIDRIDGKDGYKKSNCRWATNKEQRQNRLFKEKKVVIKRVRPKPQELILPDTISSRRDKIIFFRSRDCTYKLIGEYFGITKQRAEQIAAKLPIDNI